MKPEEIKLEDWQRILFGNITPLFLAEVFIRTLIMYLVLLTVVRWLGKRMSGQLTIIEMTMMITLVNGKCSERPSCRECEPG